MKEGKGLILIYIFRELRMGSVVLSMLCYLLVNSLSVRGFTQDIKGKTERYQTTITSELFYSPRQNVLNNKSLYPARHDGGGGGYWAHSF